MAVSSPIMRSAAILLVLGLACAHRGHHRDAPRDRAAIVEVLRAQQDAWNRGDLEGFLRGYDPGPELIFTSGAQIRRGFAETRARYQARYGAAGKRSMGRLEFEILDVRLLGADGAVVLGRWRLRFTPESVPDGVPESVPDRVPDRPHEAAPGPSEGVFSLAFLRTAAGWRIVHDHTSAAPP